MKKLLLSILLLAGIAQASNTYTTHYNLAKPSDGSTTWGADIRDDFDKIDTQMYVSGSGLSNHISNPTGAHAASAISATAGTNFCNSAINVASWLSCIDANLGIIVAGGAVTISGPQTITGLKTFSAGASVANPFTLTGVSTGVLHSDLNGLVSSSQIVDADVSSSALISRSKLAKDTAGSVLINDGSGVMSSEAQLAETRGGTGISSTATFPSSGVVVTEAATETLTNKTLTSPVINTPTGIVKGDVGLGNVDNTSDATKNAASATLTNKTISGASNTISNIAAGSSLTGQVPTANGGTGVNSTATFPTSGTVVTEAATETLTNKTLTAAAVSDNLLFTQTTTPSTPASGKNRIYFKSDDKAYTLNSAGTETAVGSGAGAGGINYISANPDAESNTNGWSAYSNTAKNIPVDGTGGSPSSTWTRVTSSPLRGTASFLWTRTANNRQGEGVSYDFTIDAADEAKTLQISFDYINVSGTFFAADGITPPLNDGTTSQNAGMSDLEVFIYDKTNAALIPVSGQVLTASGTVVPSTFKGTFQTASTSTSYRLILHTARSTAVAFTEKFDNFSVGPTVVSQGPAMGDWNTYTVSLAGAVTNPTKGSIVIDNGRWRRVGDSIEIRYEYQQNSAGSAGSGQYTYSLPPGITIDSSKINTTGGAAITSLGAAQVYDGTTIYTGVVLYGDSTHFSIQDSTSSVGSSHVGLGNTNVRYSAEAIFPVTGWSSNSNLSSDTDTRVVALTTGYQVPTGTLNSSFNITKFGTVTKDTHSGYSTSTGLYTVPVSGFYSISALVEVNGTFTAGQTAQINVSRNGDAGSGNAANNIYASLRAQASVTQTFAPSINGILFCNAGDTLGVYTNTNSTSPTYSSANGSNLSIQRISGPATIAATESVNMRYTSNIANAISSSQTLITFGTKVWDSHNAFSSGIFTAPVPGKYELSATIEYASVAMTAGDSYNMYFRVNGSSTVEIAKIVESTATKSLSLHNATTFNLNAGDTLSVVGLQNSGSNKNLSTDGARNMIEIHRIGN